MWKEYSAGYVKNNRALSLSVRVAAFISALLLSLLCGLFYNLWKYEVERIEREEGRWHSRLTGTFDAGQLETIQNFAHVKEVLVREAENGAQTVVELIFDDMKTVLADTPKLAGQIGIPPEKTDYHHSLLAIHLIRDPQDPAPRLLFPLFLLVTAMASLSLIVILHNSFAVSMHARIHQFGILSSVGATPRQLRACLLQEAAALCALPLLAGSLLGLAAGKGVLEWTNALLKDLEGRHAAEFSLHPLVAGLALLVAAMTILVSAWLPARRLSRLTPLEAIKNTGELSLNRRKRSPLTALIFGVEGELAANALKAQKKALRTASLSLFLSFLAFTLMLCFFKTSAISTRETYFERYQDAWDIMVTLKDTDIGSFAGTEAIQSLPGVKDAAVYQRAFAARLLTEEELGEEMKACGGFSQASAAYVTAAGDGYLVSVPLIILDDASFLSYCGQTGAPPRLDGAVILNRIRDVTNPDFRHPRYMPYIKESPASLLRPSGNEGEGVPIPVLSYTKEPPVLREEYATLNHYELVHFIPLSLWDEIKGQIGGAGEDTQIRILARDNTTKEALAALEGEITRRLGQDASLESENRLQEYETNRRHVQGAEIIFGGFCVLLALIGIGSVFSNTLGFVRERRREFARYLSVGMTPAGIRKMFCVEALTVAGRPILFTLPPAAFAVWGMLKMSYLDVNEFLAEAPLPPILLFILMIAGAVALAYFLGWRGIRRICLAEVLRDDTMM